MRHYLNTKLLWRSWNINFCAK